MPETVSFSRLWRFASKIRHRLQAAAFTEPLPLPQARWRDMLQSFSRLQFVQARKWQVAGNFVRTEAAGVMWSLLKHLEECQQSLSLAEPPVISSVYEIVDDLRALTNEFSDLVVELKERKVSVITDEIELDGVYLGRFRILLELDELGTSQPYSVIALDPNSAGCDRDLTHPHVRDERLCEGEGKVAIRQALQQGRLFDFFLLVRQVLETYNSDSAYTTLSNWDGQDCSDCGRRTYDDEFTSCDRCERYCCSTCCTTCTGCSETVCNACAESCSDCESSYCPLCMSGSICSTCKSDQECESNAQPAASNTTASESEEGAAVAVHPVGLGEAPVPS